MIKVIYHRNLNRVSVTGHAQSAKIGEDLVCASASILVNTLASFVENMKESGQTKNPTIQLKEGDSLIRCSVPTRFKSSVTLVFDSICAGFELLARDYPENISYEIRNS
jgi:uncharacterized protein YsxB (DUF464 family)